MNKIQIKVLLIEDNPVDIILLREALSQDALNAFELIPVDRIHAAQIILQKNTFDIILLDLGLPDSQGLDSFAQIHQTVPHMPKIILSGLTDETLALQAVYAGAQDYIVKSTAGFASAARAIRYAIERNKSQQALRSSEERFRSLFNNMINGLARCRMIYENNTAVDFVYLEVNQAFEALTGLKDVIGKPVSALIPGLRESNPEIFDVYDRVTRTGVPENFETHVPLLEGSGIWFSVSVYSPEKEQFIAIFETITERKQAEEKLRASEERFRAMIENGLDDISLLDINGNLLWESPSTVRNLGYPENAFIGRNIFEITHPEDKTWLNDLYAKLIRTPGSYQQGIFRLQHFNGSWRWVEAIATNMLDDPSVRAIVVNYRDITDRKEAEATIRSLARFPEENPNPILRIEENGKIIYANPAGRQWLAAWKLALNDPLPEEWQALVTDAYQRETKQALDISIQDRTYAIVIVPFREEGYANIYGRDVTERKQIEVSLRASEDRYRLATLATRDVIWEWRPDTGQLTWAENAQTVFGYPSEEVGPSDKWWDDHIHPEDRERVVSRLATVVDGSESIWLDEYRFLLKDGTYAYISDHGYVERDLSGKATRVIGAMSNSTERKQAEEQLYTSEQRYRTLFDASPVAIWEEDFSEVKKYLDSLKQQGVTDFKAHFDSHPEVITNCCRLIKVLNVNETALQMYQADNKEQLIESVNQTTSQGEVEHNYVDFVAIAEGRTSNSWEGGDETLKGKPIEVNLSWSVVPGYENDFSKIIFTTVDITERKRSEQGLLEANERFRQLADNIQEVFWITDAVSGQEIYISPAGEKIWGHSIKDLMNIPNIFINTIVPEDRPTVSQAIEKQRNGQRTELEYRIIHPDGSTHWIWDRAFPIFDNAGHVVRLAGIAADVTERKQVESALRQSEQSLRQVIDLVPHFIFAKDLDGRFILVNQAVADAYGTTVDKLTNKLDADFAKSTEEVDHFRTDDMDVINSGHSKFIPEEHITDANGNTRLLSTTKIPFTFSGSPSPAVLGVSIDITERKLAENALHAGEVRFAGVVNSAMDAVISLDSEQRIVLFNPAAEQMFGCQASDAIGQLVERFIPERYRPQHKQHILHFGQTGVTSRSMGHLSALSGLRSDGTEFPIEASISHIEAGGQHLYTVILRDITERKKAEGETHRHLAELEALYENGLAVGRLLNQNKIGERIIKTFARHLAWHHVAIRLTEPESDGLRLIAFESDLYKDKKSDAELLLNSVVSKMGQGLSGWVAQTGKPFRSGNVHDQPQYVTTYPNIQSGLYMPLKIGNTCIGVISVESEAPDAFTEQDERLLATLANQAAIAFENARLYQSAQQELQERKRMEAELRISETHYRELTDSITDIFFELDHDLHYTHWNKASEALTGVPAREAIGKSMPEIFGESEEQTRIEKIYNDVLINHRSRTFETPFLVQSQIRSFEVNAYPSTQGVSVVAKDVTERKRTEIIMQKRFELMEYADKATLEEIMQKAISEVCDLTESHIGFFHIVEPDQATPGLQIWPAVTLSLFNVPISEGRHRSVDQAGVWADALRQRRSIVHNAYESLPNKKPLPVGHAPITREMIIPIIRNEKILAVMGVANKTSDYVQQDLEIAERFADYAWDITERKKMEITLSQERNQLAQRVDERTIDLSRANANLARALRVKDEFLANMSHELRTPLNAILGLSESLAEQTAGTLNEKQQRYINTISESGYHLLALINDILDLAKIEAGQIALDVNKVDIRSVCDASLRMIKQLAQKKNLETLLDIDGRLGVMWADERRLKQMLVNLLSNAVKFTPKGGKLGLEVFGDQEENRVTFTIWDTGIGIQESDLPYLFQPFVQLDAGLARESSGTGLGLALVAQMARMHGGSASVVSEPGKGSRFSITLPWEPVLAVDTAERLKSTGKFKPIKFNRDQKPTILLIEDTEEVIMMVSDYLEMNNFTIITARDGLEGITQAQLTHPDLILMDVQMPRMDGFETTKKLRSEPDFKTTPIIALTALAMPDDRERCLAAGMDEYITKPIHLRALVKIIELFLSGEAKDKQP